jgi:two-component system, chemotaxis family, CheB/CheR fusion protein
MKNPKVEKAASETTRTRRSTSAEKKPKKPKTEKTVILQEDEVPFPIVGIGASAGGLDAFERFFKAMPSDSGLAFVLIQHLDPTHKSMLPELIQRFTRMKVEQIQDGIKIHPNSVYIIPPHWHVAILNGSLFLLEPSVTAGTRTPIDSFFRSLAEDRKERSICIVLSGTGTEGTLGIGAIKGEGGMVMVQNPETAQYDGMPRSAVATGLADFIVDVEEMPHHLIEYTHHAFHDGKQGLKLEAIYKKNEFLNKVFVIIRRKTGYDFSHYKRRTIMRRIERRMAINRIASLPEYIRFLQDYQEESQTLFQDLLIGVTNFFRDSDAFTLINDTIIPRLFEKRMESDPVRIWVPGCATGEEAYSLAILCQDHVARIKKDTQIQIFATDIDSRAIEKARKGIYPGNIAGDISPELLKLYFNPEENGSFQVKKNIRDMIVFAVQNVFSDPPFSNTDLISCRNLLIYLESEIQKKLWSIFHYSLKPNRFLFLGSSESVGDSELFSIVDRKWKIYKREESKINIKMGRHVSNLTHDPARIHDMDLSKSSPKISFLQVFQRTMLDVYSPPGAIINEKGEILYVQGRTGKYLELVSGEFNANILEMAREGLKYELALAIKKARHENKEIRIQKILVKTNGSDQLVNLIVRPILEPVSMITAFMVIFQETSPDIIEGVVENKEDLEAINPNSTQLERELQSTREYLQTTIEELETSNEELKSTNEELQSANEELQSTNEELETSKEELQSVNEELITVNSELEQKIIELSRIGNDMQNLLTSTEIGTMFLDINLHIRRFTPAMSNFIKLIQTDVGRHIGDIVAAMYYDTLEQDAQSVLDTLVPKELEVQTKDGRWYMMRILPYRTVQNLIDGVVITFSDITKSKLLVKELENTLEFTKNIVDTMSEALIIFNADLTVVTANNSFYELFETKQEVVLGRLLYNIEHFNFPEIRQMIKSILEGDTTVEKLEVERTIANSGTRKIIMNARQLKTHPTRILLSIEDITESSG